jgi:hypothetical protein
MRWRASRSSSTSSSGSGASVRRIAALAAVAVAVVVVAIVLLTRGGGPEDPLASVVPADAIGWVRVDPHAGGDAWGLASGFPVLRDLPQQLAGQFGLHAASLDVSRDVRPWVGGDAGLAWLPGGATLLLATVSDAHRADASLRSLGAQAVGRGMYALPSGASAGIARGVLAAGPQAAVRAALARAGRSGGGLAATPSYRRAMTGASAAPFSVYAPAAGVQRVVGTAGGLARAGASLLNSSSLEAVSAQLDPVDGGAQVHARVVRKDGTTPPDDFAPGLLGRVPRPGTVALLDMPSAGALVSALARLGGTGLISGAQASVGTEGGVDLERDVIAPLRGEAALSLQARGLVPLFTLIARTVGPPTTRAALARLQMPLAARLTGIDGTLFQQRGDGTFTLPVTPALQPSYGLSGDVLVATTAQPGLDQLRAASQGIAQAPVFAKALAAVNGSVQALGFFDLHALLALGERTGLISGSGSEGARTDLGPIGAVGAVAQQDPDHPTDTTAELFLQIP